MTRESTKYPLMKLVFLLYLMFFSFELAMVFLGPVLILAGLAAGILILRKRRRGHRMKTPKPSRRYVK